VRGGGGGGEIVIEGEVGEVGGCGRGRILLREREERGGEREGGRREVEGVSAAQILFEFYPKRLAI
jgi:hypothetical protein